MTEQTTETTATTTQAAEQPKAEAPRRANKLGFNAARAAKRASANTEQVATTTEPAQQQATEPTTTQTQQTTTTQAAEQSAASEDNGSVAQEAETQVDQDWEQRRQLFSHLNDDDENVQPNNDGATEGKAGVNKNNTQAKTTTSQTEQKEDYSKIVDNNPIAKAFLDFVKDGNGNYKEFLNAIGDTDVNSMSIGDLIKSDAIEIGLSGDELEIAVNEELDSFENLGLLKKREYEANLRKKYQAKQEEKAAKFVAQQDQARSLQVQIASQSKQQLSEIVGKMVDKTHFGLPIDKEMASQIENLAVHYSLPRYDEQGNLIGYDVQSGVEAATYMLYGKKLRSLQYKFGVEEGSRKTLDARKNTDMGTVTAQNATDTRSDKEASLARGRESVRKRYGRQ
jgi:hypothetical protein